MSRYYRENPTEPIKHEWITGGRRTDGKGSLSGSTGSDRWAIYSRRKHDRNSDWTLATSGSEAWCKKELALYLRHELRGDWHGPHYRGPYEFELRHETYPNTQDVPTGTHKP